MPEMSNSSLEQWTHIYRVILPALARAKAPSQPAWPVALDHCFARIILDSVIGRGERFDTNTFTLITTESHATPWDVKMKRPASQNLTEIELLECIMLAEAIADGKVSLTELDERSLQVRHKSPKKAGYGLQRIVKRKRDPAEDGLELESALQARDGDKARQKVATSPKRTVQTSIDSIIDCRPSKSQNIAATIDESVRNMINESQITPFRKRVFLALCQVPKGNVSSYLALSNYLESSPRAVGKALRDNPFAPTVPCHRIVAADGSIGGFGGSWGRNGEHFEKKVQILKNEGVRITEKDGRIQDFIWNGFK